MARRQYKGNAVPTKLSADINNVVTTIGISPSTNWPTGGANGPFSFIIDPDSATEEHCLGTDQSAGSITGVTRGYGDTAPVAHTAGVVGTVIHGTTKNDPDEANLHINDTTVDHHTQYMRTDGTRHDITARHQYGGALGTRPVPVAIGTALSAGAGANPSAGDHVHTIGAGSINSSGMFTAGIVDNAAIGADSVGSSELQNASIDVEALFGTGLKPIITATGDPGAGAHRFWYDTDATPRTLKQRNVADSGWELINANIIGYDISATDSGPFSGGTDITDLSMSVAVLSTRLYRVHFKTNWQLSAAATFTINFFVDAVDTQLLEVTDGTRDIVEVSFLWRPTTGTKTVDIRTVEIVGGATITLIGSATDEHEFWVEDIGQR